MKTLPTAPAKTLSAAFFTSLFVAVTGIATISPQVASAISEKDFRAHFDAEVMTFYNSAGVSGEFVGQAGVPIRYRKFEIAHEKGAIVISQGFTESYRLHAELQYDLAQAGYSVYELDHRGQGMSGRLIADAMPGYIDHFDYFSDDFKKFVDTVVRAKPHGQLYLLSNSMGGPIAANYLGQNPGVFAAAALAVPMMEVDVGDISEEQALREISEKIAQGQGAEYSWEEKPYDPNGHADPNSTDGFIQRIRAMEDIIHAHLELGQGGASWQWMYESILGSQKARRQSARTIDIPVLMLVGGKDHTVKPGGQSEFCTHAPRCRKQVITDSTHGMVIERDAVRDVFLNSVLAFFASAP